MKKQRYFLAVKPDVITRESLLSCYDFDEDTGMWFFKGTKISVVGVCATGKAVKFCGGRLMLGVANWLMYHGEYVDYVKTSINVKSINGKYTKTDLEKKYVSRSVKQERMANEFRKSLWWLFQKTMIDFKMDNRMLEL